MSSPLVLVIFSDGGWWSQPNFLTWRKKAKQLFPTFPFSNSAFTEQNLFHNILLTNRKGHSSLLFPIHTFDSRIFLVILLLSVVRNKPSIISLVFLCSLIFYLIKTILLFFAFICATHITFYLNFIIFFFCQTPCREQLKASFDNFIAKHPQGCITRKDFRGIMKNCFPQHNYEVLEKRIFNMYDANQVRLFRGKWSVWICWFFACAECKLFAFPCCTVLG